MMANSILEVSGLTKRYGSLTAVEGLSLTLERGEILGLLGPNGAGKTTTIRMICGLLKPDAGELRLEGQPVAPGSLALRLRVGVCPQESVLWEKLTCLEQLSFMAEMYAIPARAGRRRAAQLLAELGLEKKGNSLGGTLSGGMKRLLNLALALVHDPEIVVLDEPEAGLDPHARVLVRRFIQGLAASRTVLLTTHNMDEADRMADRVAIMDRGRILAVDTPETLKRQVGTGDVLELRLKGAIEPLELPQLPQLPQGLAVSWWDGSLTLRGLDLVSSLPSILAALESAGLAFEEVRLRENSLEDVFIQLTGKSLRL